MPVLIIAALFLILFLIMGVMSITAVASEHRFQREVDEYKRVTGISKDTTIGAKSATAGR